MATPSALNMNKTTETTTEFMQRMYSDLIRGKYDGSLEQFQTIRYLIETICIVGRLPKDERDEICDILGEMEATRALDDLDIAHEGTLVDLSTIVCNFENSDNECNDNKCDDNECDDNECNDNVSGENVCDETPIPPNGWCPVANTTTGCTNSECPYMHPTRACVHFRKGNCIYGESCTFAHFCLHYQRFGKCRFGESCVYEHQ